MASVYQLLIVDDAVELTSVLEPCLKEQGFAVTVAADGASGLALAKKHHPDLIVLDILLPGLDGIEFMQAVRADEWGKEVPIIVLTNISSKERQSDAILTYLPAFYLVKNEVSVDFLVEKIKLCLAAPKIAWEREAKWA